MAEFYKLSECEQWRFVTRYECRKCYVVFNNVDHYLEQKPNYEKCFHEVIFPNRPRKFFIDVDWNIDKSKKNTETFNTYIDSIKMLIIDTFDTEYEDTYINSKDIALVESSGYKPDGSYKYSANLILTTIAIPNQATFAYIGNIIVDQFNKKFNDDIIDRTQFSTPNQTFNNRLPDNTKYKENRFKTWNKKLYNEKDLILTYTDGLDEIKSVHIYDRDIQDVYIDDKDIEEELSFNRLNWKDNFEFRNIIGNIILFNRLSPSYCSVCCRDHDADNTFYIIATEHKFIYRCRRSKESIESFSRINPTQYESISNNYDSIENSRIDIDAAFPPDKRVKIIQAEMKMGKSKACREYISKRDYDSIVFISFRRTFSNESKVKYKDFTLYSDIKENEIDLELYPRLIIQVESMYRIKTFSKCNLLILDEIESIWNQFDSGNFIDLFGSIKKFEYLYKYADEVIAMDANISIRTERLFKFLKDDEIYVYKNTYNPSSEIPHYIYKDSDAWLYEFDRRLKAGHNIMVMTNSIKYCKNIKNFASKILRIDEIECYNSETLESLKKRHFTNIDKYWSKYRLVICTPTVSAGVSFEKEHFDCVMGYFYDTSCNVQTCMQMIGRVRNTKSIHIHIHKTNYDKVYLTDVEDIQEMMSSKRTELVKDSPSVSQLDFDIGEYELDYKENFHYWLVVYNIAYNNISKNDFIGVYRKILTDKGAVIKPVKKVNKSELMAVSKRFTDSTKEFKNQMVERIKFAEDIDKDKYNDIKNKRLLMVDVPEDDIIAFKKYKMVSKYNIRPDIILVQHYDNFYDNKLTLYKFNNTKNIIEALKIYDDWDVAIESIKLYEMDHYRKSWYSSNITHAVHANIKKLMEMFKMIDEGNDLRQIFVKNTSFNEIDNDRKNEFNELITKTLNFLKIKEFESNDDFGRFKLLLNEFYLISASDACISPTNIIAFKSNDIYYISGLVKTEEFIKKKNYPVINLN